MRLSATAGRVFAHGAAARDVGAAGACGESQAHGPVDPRAPPAVLRIRNTVHFRARRQLTGSPPCYGRHFCGGSASQISRWVVEQGCRRPAQTRPSRISGWKPSANRAKHRSIWYAVAVPVRRCRLSEASSTGANWRAPLAAAPPVCKDVPSVTPSSRGNGRTIKLQALQRVDRPRRRAGSPACCRCACHPAGSDQAGLKESP